jgi:hypothetical protein
MYRLGVKDNRGQVLALTVLVHAVYNAYRKAPPAIFCGRNTVDTMDVIRLTASGRPSGQQRRERQQVFHAEPRPAPTDLEARVGRLPIRPAEGHRAERAICTLERDPVLAPELLGDDEGEGLPAEGMEGVGDPNQRRINGTRCS